MLRYLLIASALFVPAIAAQAEPTKGADPLTIAIELRDADRFAALFLANDGKLTAKQLQQGYLDGAGRGVAVFTSGRIQNATALAAAVSADLERYRYAIKTCLPLLNGLTGELRAIYLAYAGLVPDRPLPAVHVVFGAGNSGGTAAPDAQVIGLEVMCGPGTTPEQFITAMRGIFAHETVHSWQSNDIGKLATKDPLLFMVLREGPPDYLASLVTGEVPNKARDEWARGKGQWLWDEFHRDRQIVLAGRKGEFDFNEKAQKAIRRWVGNYGSVPEGWPTEVGYWIGMTIAAAYVDGAVDRRKAIDDLILLKDPAAILWASKLAPVAKR